MRMTVDIAEMAIVPLAIAAVLLILLLFLWPRLSRYSPAVRWSSRAALLVFVIVATPTLIALYESLTSAVPFSSVSHRLEEYEAWIKNINNKDAVFRTVPVFFGTDRLRNDKAYTRPVWDKIKDYFSKEKSPPSERVRFGSDLGKRLTIGTAVVSIPNAAHFKGRIERPTTYTVFDVSLYEAKEDPRKHFVITDIALHSAVSFAETMRAVNRQSKLYRDTAFLFVHGYNVSFDAAIYRTAQIAADLGFDGVASVYSWPSQGEWENYETDQNVSEQSQPYLKEFLQLVAEKSGAKRIHLIAHSMGNAPLLRVLNELRLVLSDRNKINVEQIILAAPDIDRNVFENLAKNVQPIGNGMTLYASSNDRAMYASRVYAGGARAGDVPAEGPVIVSGVDTVDASRLSMSFFSLNHSDFAEKSELLADMGMIMADGARPPPLRLKAFVTINTDKGTYWKY